MSHTCYIVGAAPLVGALPSRQSGDLLIAADGGYDTLCRYDLTADLIVGDFDSLGVPPPDDTRVVALPQRKDNTDMAAAIELGWQRGYRRFDLYGGTGGRLDHTLANIQCLADLAKRGGCGKLYAADTIITALHNGALTFPPTARGTVSVFAHSDNCTGVCERGLAYALDNATLYSTRPLGVSNAFTGQPAEISVENGTLIIMYPRDAGE